METVNTKTNIKVLVKHKDGTDNKGFPMQGQGAARTHMTHGHGANYAV